MRAHGVPNFPDPSSRGGLTIGPNINPQSPAFQTAQKACARFLGNSGAPTAPGAADERAGLAFAKCMRAHGLPSFPDPALTPPRNATRAIVVRGIVFAVGAGLNPQSPAFRRATAACGPP
jgi:hypothetical protein